MKATNKSTRRSAETQKAGAARSGMWKVVREMYETDVVKAVEAAVGDGGVTLGDVMMLELAEFWRIMHFGAVDDADHLLAQKIKHLRVLCVAMGNTGDANTRAVSLPAGMVIPRLEDIAQEDLTEH